MYMQVQSQSEFTESVSRAAKDVSYARLVISKASSPLGISELCQSSPALGEAPRDSRRLPTAAPPPTAAFSSFQNPQHRPWLSLLCASRWGMPDHVTSTALQDTHALPPTPW